MAPIVTVEMAWGDEPGLRVHDAGDEIRVTVDPRLSESQVMAVCEELGATGDGVLAAGREHVGLT